MSRVRNRVWRTVVACGLAAGCAAMVWAGPVPRGTGPLARIETGGFVVNELVMRMDAARPLRVVPVRVDAATDADVVAEVESDNSAVVAVERGARILPGQAIGYAVVRAVGVGEATLRTGKSAEKVRVVAGKDGARDAGMAFGPTPRLVSPTAGAAVWGTVQIGAAAWREAGESTPKVRLRVGGESGQLLEPAWMNTAAEGPLALAAFSVDFAGRANGPCELRVVRTDARGVEHVGEAAVVQVVSPDSAAIVGGECETDYGIILPAQNGPPKPTGSVGTDRTASGGKYFNNAGTEPRFRYEVEVPSDKGAGWYQVMLTAGGDASCSALPSVGITIDEAQRPITSSAIAQPSWHRTPIGTPVLLEPGRRVVRCDYLNDFAARGTDRNLRLDRIEIARVAEAESVHGAPTSASAGGESMMAMQGGGEMMMSGAGGGNTSGAWPASARAATRPPVRIAFERPIDGLSVAGEVEIRGTVWWEDQKNSPPPQVALVVNGRERARQRSDAPRFVLSPESLAAGENTVQLVAVSDSGLTAKTAVQRIVLPAGLARGSTSEPVRATRRLTIYDPVWTPSFAKALKDNTGGEQRKSGAIAMSSQVAVDLPPDLHGEFDVWVECRSNVRAGAAERRVDLELVSGDAKEAMGPPRPVASRTAPNWFDAHRFTTDGSPMTLNAGPKRLWISVPGADGSWMPGKGSKEAVYVQGVRLVERTARTEAVVKVALEYPAQGQEVFGADALVATAMDGNALDWAEPMVDGKPVGEGLRYDLRKQGGLGRVVVPLSLRGMAAGEHRMAMRVADLRGHTAETPARVVRVLESAPEGGTTYERAVTILDRFAYGPDSRELGEILALGIDRYLEKRLASATGDDASEDAAMDLAGVRFTNLRSGYDVPRRAVQQAISTGNPVRNRFTLWAENHFSTWVRKDEAWRKWDEHERFATLGVATFYELLEASATSPAMLRYLDQERSYAGRLNENYAREIMELHTLGVHGGYTQQDVTNLAHVLTGWTTARVAMASVPEVGGATADEDGLVEEFRFEPAVASRLSEMRDVVGYRFAPMDKADEHERVLLALEVLAAHPSTARFVCTKLANHYVGVPPPEELVTDLASVFARTGGDMKEVLVAMSRHPAFWKAAAARRLSHPTDYALRLARCAGWGAPSEIGDFLGASGHGLFDRPTPDGYPEMDTEAMDSNAILQRWKLASKADGAMADGLPGAIRWGSGPMSADVRQTVVDILAMRLTGRLLGESSNAEALKVLEQAAAPANAPVEQRNHDAQVKTCAAFIAQLPEANVR